MNQEPHALARTMATWPRVPEPDELPKRTSLKKKIRQKSPTVCAFDWNAKTAALDGPH